MALSLPTHLFIHLVFSLLAGFIVWKIWKKPFLAFFCGFLGGFLIDLDHFVDYYWAFGWNWQWQYFEGGYQFLKSGKIFVLFHAWEYVIILACVVFFLKNKYGKIIFLSLALGIFFHLTTDVVIDDMPIKSYSISYRIKNNFEIAKIVKPVNYEKHLKKRALINFE